MHDVLSEVLDTLELESSVYFRAELTSPFSIAVPENRNVVRFHIASEGPCSISTADRGPLEFEPGDLVMVPHGQSHVLSDASGPPARALEEVLDVSGFDGEGPLEYGGGGEATTLVCGHFAFSADVTHPFIETLPSLIHLRRDEGPDYSWIEQMLAFTEHESRSQPRGWQGVVERLSQILFVYVLRSHLADGGGQSSALGALADPQLSEALQAMHASPATDWTLDSLAQKAGMSRSGFVRRFNAACGVSPMRYLANWRMSRARLLLAQTGGTAGEIGAQVGYASEAAFSRAFKEHYGRSPSAFQWAARTSLEPEHSGR